jgi:hypothetical protein
MGNAGRCRCENKDAMEKVDQVLHDLCQPLTTLRCRLELAGLIGTVEAYREAVELGLAQCVRLVEGVESMREIVGATRAWDGGEGRGVAEEGRLADFGTV